MHPEPKDDAMTSIMSSLRDLEISKSNHEEEINKLRKIIEELVGYEMKSKMCPKHHPLRYVQSSTSLLSHFWCDKCEKKCDKVSGVRWTCAKCNFDLCMECEGYLRSMCPYMHVLAQRHMKEEEKLNLTCNICLKQIMGTHYCCGCDFDMCTQCHSK